MVSSKYIAEKLDQLVTYDAGVYARLDLNRLAAYGISLLKEKGIPITFETVVVALFRLFPEKFCLVGFEEYPDATRVNRALLQLRPKYRGWATGDVQHGFVLTERGKSVVKETEELLKNPLFQRTSAKAVQPRTKELSRDIEDLESSVAFKKFQAGKSNEITKLDIWGFLKAVPYTLPKVLRGYLDNLKGSATALERSDVVAFLDWVNKSFPEIFREVRRG